MDKFKSRFRSLDILIIDDIQFIIGKERTQEEFFHTFNELYSNKKQIILTSDKIPQEMVGLEERLRTRFASGLSVDLQAPDFETRVAILSKKAETNGFDIPYDIAKVIANRIDTNVRELEGALTRLCAMCSLLNEKPSFEIANKVIDTIAPSKTKEVTTEKIKQVVAKQFNVSINDLSGKRRTQNIALARQIAMFLCRKYTARSFPEIGALFGGRDHSTVIHAIKSVNERLKSDVSLIKKLEDMSVEF
jgi:chromosomal replication initiator protein